MRKKSFLPDGMSSIDSRNFILRETPQNQKKDLGGERKGE